MRKFVLLAPFGHFGRYCAGVGTDTPNVFQKARKRNRADRLCSTSTKGISKSASSITSTVARSNICDYPAFSRVVPGARFKSEYESLQPNERAAVSQHIRVAGRIVSIRDLGKLVFISIRSNLELLQISLNVGDFFTVDSLSSLKSQLRAGDVIGAVGIPGRTKKR